MDIVYALLILLGLRHNAPSPHYTAPVQTLPLIVEAPLETWEWGPSWR